MSTPETPRPYLAPHAVPVRPSPATRAGLLRTMTGTNYQAERSDDDR